MVIWLDIYKRCLCLYVCVIYSSETINYIDLSSYSGADKSLVRPGRKQATATEDFDVHV